MKKRLFMAVLLMSSVLLREMLKLFIFENYSVNHYIIDQYEHRTAL